MKGIDIGMSKHRTSGTSPGNRRALQVRVMLHNRAYEANNKPKERKMYDGIGQLMKNKARWDLISRYAPNMRAKYET